MQNEEEEQYYPDDLGIDENVILSSRTLAFPPLTYYYVTNKRVFSENKLTGKKEVIEHKKVSDLHIEQNKIENAINRGNIILMHSNYKKEVPIMRRKYFKIRNIKNPHEAFAKLRSFFRI
ncbi:MAG: hypothetical protein ACOCUR_02100 [Nanoarchaeota archaeon]